MKYCILLVFLLSCSNKTLQQAPISKESNHFTGIHVEDLYTGEILISENSNKYFTPASTLKLFTYAAAFHVLKDSINAFHYADEGDSLVLFGSANPLFLHPEFNDSTLLHFLASRNEHLYFSDKNWHAKPLGSGWAWDDVSDDYSAELSALPVHGNIARVMFDSTSQTISVSPAYFTPMFKRSNSPRRQTLRVWRAAETNTFYYTLPTGKSDTVDVPFRVSETPMLLASIAGKAINRENFLSNAAPQTARIKLPDSLYRIMLTVSDNFLAEHLLLQISDREYGAITAENGIDFALDSILPQFKNPPRWVDGSGLSRYNLVTPKSLIGVLKFIFRTIPEKQWKHDLPSNSEGTLKRRLLDMPQFIYAKTGTLSNNHNLAGFLRTKSGRWLAFAVMTNHYRVSIREIQREVDSFLKSLYFDQN